MKDTDLKPSPCRADLESMATDAGAVSWGIASATPIPDNDIEKINRWIDDGCHASMDYLRRHAPLKKSLDSVLPGCRSVLSFAFPYYSPLPSPTGDVIFARYAIGDDYHDVIRRRLKPMARFIAESFDAETRVCVDTAPVAESYWAQKAGVGVKCRNGLTVVPGYGSWVFLAEILTTAVFSHDFYSQPSSPAFSLCGTCEACLKACPGQAIMPGGMIDCRRCRSYLTIEFRGETLPDGVELGKRVYGCDICQEVCPLNRSVPEDVRSVVPPREIMASLDRKQLLEMDDNAFRNIFGHSAVRRISSAQLRRNCSN